MLTLQEVSYSSLSLSNHIQMKIWIGQIVIAVSAESMKTKQKERWS